MQARKSIAAAILGLSVSGVLAADAPPAPSPAPPASPPPSASPSPALSPSLSPTPASAVGLSLFGGQLRGTASYGRHAPAIGAVVIVRPDAATTPVRVSTTGEDGAFAFDHLEDGAYRVEVRREGYAPVVKTGIAVRAPFRAVAELLLVHGTEPHPAASSGPPGTDGHRVAVKGTVRLLAGAAVSEARVRLTRVDGGDDPRALLSGVDGRFAVDGLAAGTWRIEILGAGLLPLRTTIDLVADTTLEAQLATQPANYQPSPQDLIVPEEAIPPKGV